MKRVRVLHCIETLGSGGVEQTRLTLARMLPEARYEQALVCTQAIGGLPPLFRDSDCPVHAIGVFRGITDRVRYQNALRIVKAFKPDIIHGAVYEGVATAAIVGRLARVPVIIGEETSDPVDRRWKGHLLYRGLAALTHQMVAVSPAVERYLVDKIRIPAGKVRLINNGVAEPEPPLSSELDALRARWGIPADCRVIGSCGRVLDSHKRFSDLIRALAVVREQIPHVRLLIVGSGPDLEVLQKLAESLGLSDRVIFTGYQERPWPYYWLMNVFALASVHEAFGLVLVEAMFAGLPIVATRVGGIPNVVEEGVTALLVHPAEPTALAACLTELLSAPVRAKDMGNKGRLRAQSKFSAQRYVDEIDDLYQHLIGERGAA